MNFAAVCMFHVCKCLFGKTLRFAVCVRCCRLHFGLRLENTKICEDAKWISAWIIFPMFIMSAEMIFIFFFREFSSPRFNIKNLFINKTQKFFFRLAIREKWWISVDFPAGAGLWTNFKSADAANESVRPPGELFDCLHTFINLANACFHELIRLEVERIKLFMKSTGIAFFSRRSLSWWCSSTRVTDGWQCPVIWCFFFQRYKNLCSARCGQLVCP